MHLLVFWGKANLFSFSSFWTFWGSGGNEYWNFWVFQKEVRCFRTVDFRAAQTSRTSECFPLCLHRNSFLPPLRSFIFSFHNQHTIVKEGKRRVTAGKPANHSSIRADSRACGANLCDLHKGPLWGEPFFLPCNGKEKTWQLLWSAKQKQGEQGANGQLCAQNCEVSAGFLCAENSVTTLHRTCTRFCRVLGYLWHSFRKSYCSKLREYLGCCQLRWSEGVSTNNLQCESEGTFPSFF